MKIKYILSLIIIIVLSLNAKSQDWTQIGSTIYGENAYDHSGCSVALSSDASTIVIGAEYNIGTFSGINDSPGHVRVYKNILGTWTQVGQDIDGETITSRSGSAVSINSDGTIIAVGAKKDSQAGDFAGQVRIFELQSDNWVQIGNDIFGENEYDYLGGSISLSSDGQTIAIGVTGDDANGAQTGEVKILVFINNEWIPKGNSILGTEGNSFFGYSVSINDDASYVAIGANGADAAFVYKYDEITEDWVQVGQKLDAEEFSDYFGGSIDISSDGTIIAVGAPNNDGGGMQSGHVRAFQFDSNSQTWLQIGQDINGEHSGDHFAPLSLSSSGLILAVGGPRNYDVDYETGNTRIYEFDTGNNIWNQVGVDIDGVEEYDLSGTSVSISADGLTVATGAPQVDDGQTGYAKIYELLTAGTNDISNSTISIYPNPTNGILNVNFSKVSNFGKVEITNITGKIVKQLSISNKKSTINLENQPAGIYFIKIQTNKGLFINKIIKK